MKTYVVTISRNFPATHPKSGQPTGFSEKIRTSNKIHTIRGNYELWKKRFDEIEKGNALLSVREWVGKPYRSKQKELFYFTNSDFIGVEKLDFTFLGFFINDIDNDVDVKTLAMNDGLSRTDFVDWFSSSLKPDMPSMAIIHFTDFRYSSCDFYYLIDH